MSVNVPRGTRAERLSLRIPVTLKEDIRHAVARLQARGLGTSASELIEMFVAQAIQAPPAELDARLRAWRRSREAA